MFWLEEGTSTNNRIFALILGQNEPSVQTMAQAAQNLGETGEKENVNISLFSIKISPTMQINMFIHILLDSILEY